MNAGVILTTLLGIAFVYWMWRILPTSQPEGHEEE